MAVVDSSTTLAPSRAVIDLEAYAHNLDVARACIGPTPRIMAVMKADAYGHGLIPIARAAVCARADMLGVATVEEGISLRAAGMVAPVVVLFQPPPGAAEALLEHDLTLVLADLGMAEELSLAARRMGRTARVHCQVDTGMGRQGFTAATAIEDLQAVMRLPGVDIEGVCTHFPTAYYEHDAATTRQHEQFQRGPLTEMVRRLLYEHR